MNLTKLTCSGTRSRGRAMIGKGLYEGNRIAMYVGVGVQRDERERERKREGV